MAGGGRMDWEDSLGEVIEEAREEGATDAEIRTVFERQM